MKIIKLPENYIEKKYNYVYKLTLKNDRRYYYYGKHSTNNINDNYFGSGSKIRTLKCVFGKDCFEKEIIEYFNTCKEALIAEAKIVTEDVIKDEFCLNRITGGGGFSNFNISFGHTGIKHTNSTKKKISKSKKGTKFTKTGCENISKSLLGHEVTEETRKKIRENNIGKHNITEETRKKLIKSHIGQYVSEETKRKISENLKNNPQSAKNRVWVNNEKINKRILKKDLDFYIKNNWNLGVKKFKK